MNLKRRHAFSGKIYIFKTLVTITNKGYNKLDFIF